MLCKSYFLSIVLLFSQSFLFAANDDPNSAINLAIERATDKLETLKLFNIFKCLRWEGSSSFCFWQEGGVRLPNSAKLHKQDAKNLDPLSEVDGFLRNDKKILLLSGGLGCGKTLFLQFLENHIWGKIIREVKPTIYPVFPFYPVPVYIEVDVLGSGLDLSGFVREVLENVDYHRKTDSFPFVFLLDLESYKFCHPHKNSEVKAILNFSNLVKECGGCKFIIACRDTDTELISQIKKTGEVQDVFLMDFDPNMINEYMKNLEKSKKMKSGWTAERYLRELKKIGLSEVVQTPAILSVVSEILPDIIDAKHDEKVLKNIVLETLLNRLFSRDFLRMGAANLGYEVSYPNVYWKLGKQFALAREKQGNAPFSYYKGLKDGKPSDWHSACEKRYLPYNFYAFRALPFCCVGDGDNFKFIYDQFFEFFLQKAKDDLLISAKNS